MKKMLALWMAIALIVSAAAFPALAEQEGETADAVSSATAHSGQEFPTGSPRTPGNRNSGSGQQSREIPGQGSQGRNGWSFPQMPGNDRSSGQDNQNGNAPQMPGSSQGGQNGNTPQMPGSSEGGQNGTVPQMPGNDQNGGTQNDRNGKFSRNGGMRGGKPGKNGQNKMRLDFDELLKEGVIDQTVYDAIMAYMKEHAPQQPSSSPADGTVPAEGSEPPALPDGTAPAEGSEPPALPDGTAPAEGSEPPALPDGTAPAEGSEPEGMEEALLKELLDNEIISRELYEVLLTRLSETAAAETAAAAGSDI